MQQKHSGGLQGIDVLSAPCGDVVELSDDGDKDDGGWRESAFPATPSISFVFVVDFVRTLKEQSS